MVAIKIFFIVIGMCIAFVLIVTVSAMEKISDHDVSITEWEGKKIADKSAKDWSHDAKLILIFNHKGSNRLENGSLIRYTMGWEYFYKSNSKYLVFTIEPRVIRVVRPEKDEIEEIIINDVNTREPGQSNLFLYGLSDSKPLDKWLISGQHAIKIVANAYNVSFERGDDISWLSLKIEDVNSIPTPVWSVVITDGITDIMSYYWINANTGEILLCKKSRVFTPFFPMPTPTAKPAPTPEKGELGFEREWQNLLPLSEDNEWEYKITIPVGGDFYFFDIITRPYPGAHTRQVTGLILPEPGEYSLKFVVTNETEDLGYIKYWRIQIEKDSLGIYNSRSKDIESVWWGYHIQTDEMVEKLEYEPVWTDEFSGTGLFFMKPEGTTISEGFGNKTPFMYSTRLSNQDVTIPAGKFSNCWVFVRRKPSAGEPDIDFPPSLGFKTYSYYAPDVGLVKQYQEDSEGHSLYTMELKSYKVTPSVKGNTPTPTPPVELFGYSETVLIPLTKPTPTPTPPGFEAVFAIAGLLVVAYLLRRRK